jgi:hypothetical protein
MDSAHSVDSKYARPLGLFTAPVAGIAGQRDLVDAAWRCDLDPTREVLQGRGVALDGEHLARCKVSEKSSGDCLTWPERGPIA